MSWNPSEQWWLFKKDLYFEVLSTIKWDDTLQPGSLFPSRATVSKNEYFVLFHVRTVIGEANEFERMDGRTDPAIRSSWRQTFFLLSTYIDLVLFLVGKWKL